MSGLSHAGEGTFERVLGRWADLEARPRVILGLDLELIWSNTAADEAMADGSEVALVDGRLRLADPRETESLRAFVAESTGTVSAWCATRGDGRGVLFRAWRIEVDDRVCVGIVFHPAGERYLPQWADFSRVFGLTGSEFRVALRLLDGLQIEAVASAVGITVGTARIHVRNLYGKLNVNSREAMFRLLAPFRIA